MVIWRRSRPVGLTSQTLESILPFFLTKASVERKKEPLPVRASSRSAQKRSATSRQIAGADLGIFLAKKAAAGVGFKGAYLHRAGAAVAFRPECGHHNVGSGKLKALEIQRGRFVTGQNRAAEHGFGSMVRRMKGKKLRFS